MAPNKILSATLLELVFDGRNKEYGAYELRKTYNGRITKALLITSTISILAIGVVLAGSKNQRQADVYKIIPIVEIAKIDHKDPSPPPAKKKKVPPERTVHDATIKIVPNDQVIIPPPSNDDKQNAISDIVEIDGPEPSGIARPGDLDGNTDIIEASQHKSNEPVTSVEFQAKFNGDWARFLRKYLRGETPVDQGAPAGRYQVRIQFVVDVDGTVSDIKALSNVGFGMEEEAIRVITKSNKWEPAMQNGVAVKAYRVQPITFEVTEE